MTESMPTQESPEWKNIEAVLLDLSEAVRSCEGGEVVVRSGVETARIYVVAGHIAWVVASSWKERLGQYLIKKNLLTFEDWTGVFEECRRTGANVGETCVERGLVSYEDFHDALLTHIVHAFVSLLGWPDLKTMFVPFQRIYKSNLIFGCREFLGVAIANGMPLGELLQTWLADNPELLISGDECVDGVRVPATSAGSSAEETSSSLSAEVKASFAQIESIKGFRAMASGLVGGATFYRQPGTLGEDAFTNLLRTMTQLYALASQTTAASGFGGASKMVVRTGDYIVLLIGGLEDNDSQLSVMLVVESDANLVLFEHHLKRHIVH